MKPITIKGHEILRVVGNTQNLAIESLTIINETWKDIVVDLTIETNEGLEVRNLNGTTCCTMGQTTIYLPDNLMLVVKY